LNNGRLLDVEVLVFQFCLFFLHFESCHSFTTFLPRRPLGDEENIQLLVAVSHSKISSSAHFSNKYTVSNNYCSIANRLQKCIKKQTVPHEDTAQKM